MKAKKHRNLGLDGMGLAKQHREVIKDHGRKVPSWALGIHFPTGNDEDVYAL